MKTWLFNPFKYMAGGKALLVGAITMFITATLAWYGTYHLDGVLDAHTNGKAYAYYLSLLETVIDWLSMLLPLYIFGRILSGSSVRFIDFAGTQAMARYPIFFVVLIGVFFSPDIKNIKPDELVKTIMNNPTLMAELFVTALLLLPIAAWAIVLMVNAYKISANLKGAKAAWSFVVSIIIAEIISKVIITSLT